jgi:hypothetical protein
VFRHPKVKPEPLTKDQQRELCTAAARNHPITKVPAEPQDDRQ